MSVEINVWGTTEAVFPDLVIGYDASFQTNTVVHNVMDRDYPEVTLRESSLAAGELTLFFTDRADAWAALAMHRTNNVFFFLDTDLPEMEMKYVVAEGDLSISLDDQSRLYWFVTVPFRQVR